MKVANRKIIRKISLRSLTRQKGRNVIVVLAIILTSILFTTMFTIGSSINHAFQQSNFRQVGGYAHAGFKYITKDEIGQLQQDSKIKKFGLRQFVGSPTEAPFNKAHVEVGYSDQNYAKWTFSIPEKGRLPKEGTNEAATDTRVLSLLGIEPKIGERFTLKFLVDGKETTQTFSLSGWWKYDEASSASHVLIPESRASQIFDQLQTIGDDGLTTLWTMDVMFRNSIGIGDKIKAVLKDQDFQNTNENKANYIATGTNWGYSGAKAISEQDPMAVITIAVLLILIMITSYLIIYNVFQISVTNDIRFYGLLKTIGTTGRQIKRLIRLQGIILSCIGIPVGLILGYLIGIKLTPAVLNILNDVTIDSISVSPLIFIFSAIFSFGTVIISCRRPGKLAAKVSPVEAIRYTDGVGKNKKIRKTTKGASIAKMAWANLGRNRLKTLITVISLSLAVVLLNLTTTLVNGFDMDKYLRKMTTDYIVADAGYFQVNTPYWTSDMTVPEEAIEEIKQQKGITDSGRIYGQSSEDGVLSDIHQFVSEDIFRKNNQLFYDQHDLDTVIDRSERSGDLLADDLYMYGMEDFILRQLTTVKGNLQKIKDPTKKYIAAVYQKNDYDSPIKASHWAKVGDTVTIRYTDKWEYFDPDTGEIFDNQPEERKWERRSKEYRDVEYQVAALVTIPNTLDYRFYGRNQFILDDKNFIADSNSDGIMSFAFDTSKRDNQQISNYLQNFTENEQSQLDFESKETYLKEFESMKNMFALLGGVLCLIIGIVGILNFINAILSGILARRREFAVLQSVGMTGKQLKLMLVWEGLYYTIGAALVSLGLCLISAPLLSQTIEKVLWFFSYQFTIVPVLIVFPIFVILGIFIPLISYYFVAKQPIIERLRKADN